MLNELKKKKIRLDNNNNNNNQSKRYFIYSLLVFLSLIAALYCLQINFNSSSSLLSIKVIFSKKKEIEWEN